MSAADGRPAALVPDVVGEMPPRAAHQLDISVRVSRGQPSPDIATDVTRCDHPEQESMRRNLCVPTLVVDPPLGSPVDAADREPVRLVEELDRLVVLQLAVFNDETQ